MIALLATYEDKSKEQVLRCLGDAVKMDTGESFYDYVLRTTPTKLYHPRLSSVLRQGVVILLLLYLPSTIGLGANNESAGF